MKLNQVREIVNIEPFISFLSNKELALLATALSMPLGFLPEKIIYTEPEAFLHEKIEPLSTPVYLGQNCLFETLSVLIPHSASRCGMVKAFVTKEEIPSFSESEIRKMISDTVSSVGMKAGHISLHGVAIPGTKPWRRYEYSKIGDAVTFHLNKWLGDPGYGSPTFNWTNVARTQLKEEGLKEEGLVRKMIPNERFNWEKTLRRRIENDIQITEPVRPIVFYTMAYTSTDYSMLSGDILVFEKAVIAMIGNLRLP